MNRAELDENKVYAIELAKRVTDRCVRSRLLTQDQGQFIFDSLVDGLYTSRTSNELAQMILDIGGNYNDND